ncbi:MAG TPA: tetratricopeptide repeat protein, partial [Casimicrobiaceae bacterium]|nr:tetratricopeptide repeat protein [Casimicrobiaceae bacterium]
LAWFDGEDDPPPPADDTWTRLSDLFEEDGEGYYRFRQSLLRDTAYEGLPYKVRRRLHAIVAAHVEEEADHPDEVAGILSLHCAAAGDYVRAWRYGTLAAKRAEAAYAFVEAVGLYSRALEAGRKLPELSPREIGHVQESLADSWYRAGEYRKALDAYRAALDLIPGERLLEANVLLKISRAEHKLGEFADALRSVERAREVLGNDASLEVSRLVAKTSSWYASVLAAQGRAEEALKWSEQAAREADEVDDPEALGDAYLVMGWAYGVSGKEGGEALMLKALEAFRRCGDRVSQASIVFNLGVVCQWEGRWDDAMAYYERGRDESLKIGDLVNVGIARMNLAEILIDRGEFDEAEKLLDQTLPVWKSSEYRFFLGVCHLLLGRLSLRAGRIDDALARLEQARTMMTEVGAEHEVIDIDARIAECRLFKGDPDGALALADEIVAKEGVPEVLARLAPHLQRVRGYAMLMQADPFGAREAFEASLAAARERKDIFETVRTLTALIELDGLEGVEPPQDVVDESREVIAKLKIRALPAVPSLA